MPHNLLEDLPSTTVWAVVRAGRVTTTAGRTTLAGIEREHPEYHRTSTSRAEYFFTSPQAALARQDEIDTAWNLGGIRLKHSHRMVLVSAVVPDGRYVDAYTPLRSTQPPARDTDIWGQSMANAGYDGIGLAVPDTVPFEIDAGFLVVIFLNIRGVLDVTVEETL